MLPSTQVHTCLAFYIAIKSLEYRANVTSSQSHLIIYRRSTCLFPNADRFMITLDNTTVSQLAIFYVPQFDPMLV